MMNDNHSPTERLEPEAVEKKRRKESKSMKRLRQLQASANDNPYQEAFDHTLSVSSTTDALDTGPMSFAPENLLMDGPRPTVLKEVKKKIKEKKKKKKKLAKSKLNEISRVSETETSGFASNQMASIEDWQDEVAPDRKLTPAEKAAAEKERLNDSIRSTESSIFSSHPIASTAVRDATSKSYGYGRDRSSILDDVDSVGIGMTGKSDDDTLTLAGFPVPSSKGLDFPLPSATGMETVEQQAQIPQVLSVSSVARSRGSRSSGKGEEKHVWESVQRQDQSSLVEGTDFSSKTKSSGESTPKIENVEERQRPDSFPIHSIIMQKAEEAMRSSIFTGPDSSLTRKSVGESSHQAEVLQQRQRIASHAIHTITMQQKAEEAMTSSAIPAAQHGQRSLPIVKPGMSNNGHHIPNGNVAEDTGNGMPVDMLVRYLRSMGTSYRTAVDIAARFREQQAAQGVTPAAGLPQASSPVPPTLPIQSTAGSTRVIQAGSAGEGAVVGANTTPGRNRGSGARARARRSQNALLWERSMQPGAVQMEGRAFGAPVRPDLPERPAEDDDEVILEAVEAMAVDDLEQGPVVYADSTPLSWKELLMEKSIRRRVIILCFIIVAVTVISVSVAVVKSPGAPDVVASATDAPSSAPSLAPTFIADDILSYTAKLSGSEAVSTPGTPQHSAVGWLSTFDTFSEGFSELFDQRYAMVTFFYSLGGENWLEQDSWLAPDMHECDWSAAIFCNVDGTGRRIVSGLDLTKNGLLGSLPVEIGLTTQLEFLRLSQNAIQGTVPSELFVLPVLGVLDLHVNELVGSLPENLGTEMGLVYLDVSYNRLTGTIPDGFCNLTLLRIADLKFNHFSGRLPSNLQKLKVIDKVSVSSNHLTGTIPEFSVVDLPGFDTIDLGDNLLTGTLPSWILALLTRQDLLVNSNLLSGTIPDSSSSLYVAALFADPDALSAIRLRRVDLSDNYLSGTLPNWGVFLPTLVDFDFSNNKFNGTIPFGAVPTGGIEWPSLESANFANNALSGTIPTAIPSALNFLDVSGNLLEGTVPLDLSASRNLEFLFVDNNQRLNGNLSALLTSSVNLRTLSARNTSLIGRFNGRDISALRKMEILDLANNKISGTIPTEFGDMQLLKKILLGSNKFSGLIPSEFGNMDDLLVLSLGDNLLSGSIPQTLGRLTSLEDLVFAGNDQLSGSLPEALCSLDTLNVTRLAIGCELVCSCCSDPSDLCEGSDATAKRANIFVETRV